MKPDLLTPERQDKICLALAAGNTRADAAILASVTPRTFRNWMSRGCKSTRGKFRNFREAVQKAEAECAARQVAIVLQAARGDASRGIAPTWTAAAWWLERKRPDDFGRKDRSRVEVTGRKGRPIKIELTDEQRAKALTAISAAVGHRGTGPLPDGPSGTNGHPVGGT